MSTANEHPNAALLASATKGFDCLFGNDIVDAKKRFSGKEDAFHLLGLGVCSFLEAALGMEEGLMTEASRCLTLAEAGSKKEMKVSKTHGRPHAGLEWEIINADAVVLLGLTHALNESYMGYLQCLYALNSAHSKFTKLYKTVFPLGLESYAHSPSSSTTFLHPNPSSASIASASTSSSAVSHASTVTSPAPARSGFFGRIIGSGGSSTSLTVGTKDARAHVPHSGRPGQLEEEGPVEELIFSGTAFGYGLFNLVFSLLPKKVQSLVGFLGYKHDRALALQALAVSATKSDVHSVFAGLVLMTYHGVVLLLSGYQADHARILSEYKALVDRVEKRYPQGALWILNRAKILRMSGDSMGAISVLEGGLRPERPHVFVQGDMMLIFELSWTLLSQRKYEQAADAFLRIVKMNSWSHGTYYFIAAGCYFSIGDLKRAQELFDQIPKLIDKKVGGKDLPTEVFIKKKIAFYKEKQLRRGGKEENYVEAIRISPAEEMAIFWNSHAHINASVAQAHVTDLISLTPPVAVSSPLITSPPPPSPTSPLLDLDTPDELALRALLLGVNHRTAGAYVAAREFLAEAYEYQSTIKVSTWISGVAMFELAVLDLMELDAEEKAFVTSTTSQVNGLTIDGTPTSDQAEYLNGANAVGDKQKKQETVRDWKAAWKVTLASASAKLDTALGLATNATDLSSRLDSRIMMLRDEIEVKRKMVGVR
ncbi:hypothetical protein BDQ17DRAFT_1431489 [Cyathus striatus]|nr:hypothetical protein BDQ17DRAFT_1431489 [Cyathus striatus]